jgi:hypothetical protein
MDDKHVQEALVVGRQQDFAKNCIVDRISEEITGHRENHVHFDVPNGSRSRCFPCERTTGVGIPASELAHTTEAPD